MSGQADYEKFRLLPQIEWYDKQSQQNKRLYFLCGIVRLALGLLIPILVLLAQAGYIEKSIALTIAGVVGLVVVSVDRIESLYSFHGNWLNYRATAEELKRTHNLYRCMIEPFNNNDRETVLADCVESIVSKEVCSWYTRMKTAKYKPKDVS